VTIVALIGSGGVLYYVAFKDRHPGPQLPFDPEKKNLVILGTGWGATSLLKSIDTMDYNVIVISPRNFFLFTPLLPSAAVGTLNTRSIMQRMSACTFYRRHKANTRVSDPDDYTAQGASGVRYRGRGAGDRRLCLRSVYRRLSHISLARQEDYHVL
jgi:hypothetical protein